MGRLALRTKEYKKSKYLQSFSIAGDIPWHGFESQSMAVYCGATAGTQGWAGTGFAYNQGREHHHPHPVSSQSAHPWLKAAILNGHVHHLSNLSFTASASQSPATPHKSAGIN